MADDAHAARGRDDDEDLMGYMGYTWDVGERGPTGPMARLRWNKRVYTGLGRAGQHAKRRAYERGPGKDETHRLSGQYVYSGGVRRPPGNAIAFCRRLKSISVDGVLTRPEIEAECG